MESNGSRKIRMIITGLIGILILIIAVTAFLLVQGRMTENNYTASIQEAEKYLAENNYEQAIISYRNAISIDSKKEEPYIALADIYVAQDNTSKARSILEKGYEETESARIKGKLSRLEKQYLTAKSEDGGEKIDYATASQDIAWNTSFLQKVINYTFDDYKNEFGRVESASIDDEGYLEVRHARLGAVCYYKNTADNKEIVNTSKKSPYASAMPEKIVLDSIETLFRNFEGGAGLNRMQMLFGERVTPKTLEGRMYIENKEEDLIARIGTDSEGNITSPSSWNELILPLANQTKNKGEILEGVVVDAVSGRGISGAKLTFDPKKSSHKTVTETTDSRGAFRAELEADEYTITIQAAGYVTEEFLFTVKKGESYSGEQFVISSELTEEARIVLEWGAEPVDLDSHLQGQPDGSNNIHVFWGNKQASSGGNTVAELDLDDTNGYGPETTTIHNLNGVYTFSVHDYRNTGMMAENGATVKIYLPGQAPVVVQLNTGSGVNNVWTVCRIDHGRLEVLNTAGSESDN